MPPPSVPQIDFLPASYRARSAKQRDRVWRLGAAGVAVALLVAAWIFRHVEADTALAELDSYRESYEVAVATKERWAILKRRRSEADVQAQLVTFLRHPWPTSRLLAAVIPGVPGSIKLSEIKVVHETTAAPDAALRRATGGKPDVADLERPAAERDLERLQGEVKGQRTVLLLAGETSDGDELHRYIGQLPTSPVVLHAELLSLQSNAPAQTAGGGKGPSEFNVRVVLRPSLIQPSEKAPHAVDGQPERRLASDTRP